MESIANGQFVFGKCLVEQVKKLRDNKKNNSFLTDFFNLEMTHAPECTLSTNPCTKNNGKIPFASVGVVVDKDGNVLMTRRNKNLKSFPSAWVFPGGHVEKNENFFEGMLREVYEETGIQVMKNGSNFFYNSMECEVKPIFLYESIYPDCEHLKYQTFIVFYKVKLPVKNKDVEIKIQFSEVDAYAWINIKSIYEMCFETGIQREVNGFLVNEKSGRIEENKFTQNSFSSYNNNQKNVIKKNKKKYVPQGHVTTIKMLYFNYYKV